MGNTPFFQLCAQSTASKAEGDLALIQTSLLFSFDLYNKSGEVFIKTRSPSASLPSKGQVTEQTTVKCYIAQAWVQDGWVTVQAKNE